MNKLIVYCEELEVGALIFDGDERLSFEYDTSWLKHPSRFPLSIAMPLSEKPFGHLVTKSFFENLLPEGNIRALTQEHGKNSIQTEFGFLKEFGGDCAGAFKIRPEKISFSKSKLTRKELNLSTIYGYLKDKKSLADEILNHEGGKFSLAGAQDKFAIIYEQKKIYLPLDGTPTTHIIKPAVRNFKSTHDTPYNEYFCMKLANAVGLHVPHVDIIEGEFPLFITQRFDRFIDKKGKVCRIHQQDFCQAQGFTSLKKYETEGGPTFKDNYELIKSYSASPIPDLNQLLKWLLFNLVIGNNDSHSKNLAFLQTTNGIRLAPFYDILSTSIYKEVGQRFSFKIGGQNLWFKLKTRTFQKFSLDLGLNDDFLAKQAKNLFSALDQRLPIEIQDFKERFPEQMTSKVLEEEIKKRMNFFHEVFGI
ncbi:MAG: type II toxin-antitoxin system HipA family toxin [Pseudomonadota bacterium]